MTAKKPRAMVGRRTPAQALSMWRRSSWRLRKYQGALDGFGVTSELARFRSGALMKTESIRKLIVKRTAAMNSMNTRSGQTRTSSSRSRLGLGRARAPPTGRPASTAIECGALLQRPGHAAVAADAPEMDGHKNGGQKRQSDDVQRVEAYERCRADLEAAEDDELRLVPEVGGGATDAVADGDGPEGQLVPGEQVASEAEDERQHYHHDSDHPL